MRPLHRPMFRYGGPIKEGVMSGIREPKRSGGSMGNLVGSSLYPKTNGREHHFKNYFLNLLGVGAKGAAGNQAKKTVGTEATKKIKSWFQPKTMPSTVRYGLGKSRVPTKMERIKNWYSTTPIGKYVAGTPEGKGITYALGAGKGIVPKIAKASVKSPLLLGGGIWASDVLPGGQPLLNLDMLGNRNILGQKYDPETDKRIKGTGISSIWEDEEVKIDDPDKTTETNPWKDKYEALLAANETPQKSDEQIRNERIQKYRDIMDIKGMNKRAAYDSLIDASKLIQESGDFKGDIKSGKLINQIIQATSKAYDKPSKTKDAIDTLILKGEIEKDIKSTMPTEAEKTAAAFGISKDEYKKKLLGKDSAAQIIASISTKTGRVDSTTVASGYKASGIVPKATITDTIIDEWIDDNSGKTEIDYVKEVVSKADGFGPGLYVVGDRAILFDGTNYSYDY